MLHPAVLKRRPSQHWLDVSGNRRVNRVLHSAAVIQVRSLQEAAAWPFDLRREDPTVVNSGQIDLVLTRRIESCFVSK